MSYSDKVINHFQNPQNVGSMERNDHDVGTGMVGAPACGDVMRLQLRINTDGIIEDAKFKTFGCGSAIASSSLITTLVKGKHMSEAESINKAGDAIMTGTEGEQWPIPAEKFAQTYDDLGDGTAAKKNIPVFAMEMHEPFQVKVSWSDDLLQGEVGDYLVQYGPGDYGVVGREIFGKTYETPT